jgi:cytochrome P450
LEAGRQDTSQLRYDHRVTSYAEVHEILRNSHFVSGEYEEEWDSPHFRKRTLLVLEGREHIDRRRLQSPLVDKGNLDHLEDQILVPAIRECLAHASSMRGPDGVVRADCVDLTCRIFLRIAIAVIGLDDVDMPERSVLLEHCMHPLNAAYDGRYATRNHDAVVAEGVEAKEAFVRSFYTPSADRRSKLLQRIGYGEVSEGDPPMDLVTLMRGKPEDEADLDLPVREAILYLAALTHSTSTAVVHAVVEAIKWLSDHPHDRARTQDATFLRGVCNETLRLHSGIRAVARRASRDLTLSTGRVFRSGDFVALDIVEASRDPEVFGPDANRFNPWRQVPAGVRPYGLAFGAGRHVCVGLPLVTTPSGRPASSGESDRVMMKILLAFLNAGIELDPESSPDYEATEEEIYATLPVVLKAL